jgi:hypothetical protein
MQMTILNTSNIGNKRLLELIDNILAGSVSPPLIIVLSDHGFRHPEKNV